MSTQLNKHLFSATRTASNDLTVLGTLVHRFPDDGDYLVSVSQNGEPVGERLVVVDEEYHSRQATIDLAAVDSAIDQEDRDCGCEGESFHCIRPDGHVTFHVSSGPGGYDVVVDPLAERDVREFEGNELTEYDHFAATLLRPGTYTMRNTLAETEGEITVAYPDPDRDRPSEAARVTASDDGFEPESVDVVPAQGVVFEMDDPARIVVELDEPHEDAREDVSDAGRSQLARDSIRATPSFDPAELTVDEVETELEAVSRRSELRSLLLTERAGENRRGVVRAIRNRYAEL